MTKGAQQTMPFTSLQKALFGALRRLGRGVLSPVVALALATSGVMALAARGWRRRALPAVVTAVAVVATGTTTYIAIYAAPAQADTICSSAPLQYTTTPSTFSKPRTANTCTTTAMLPTGAPPALLDLSGNYSATAAQAASLQDLENQAVANTISDHDLSTSDTDAVLTWGRDDAEGELWALLVQAVNDCATATCTTDQQNAVDWLESVETNQEVQAAQDAGKEYAEWAGIPGYESELAGHPSESALQNFLSAVPEPYVYYPGTQLPEPDMGYCTYQPPGGGYDPDTQLCYTTCSSELGCAPNTPTYDQFIQWGDDDAEDPTLDGTAFADQASEIALGATFGSAAVGAGVGAALSASLGGLLSGTALQAAIFPFAAKAINIVLDGVWYLTTSAEAAEAAGAITAGAVGFVVGIAIAAITAAVLEGLAVVNAAELPSQIAAAVTSTPPTPNLESMLSSQSGIQNLYSLFVGATLPLPTLTPCPGGASACPVSGSTYPDFLVTPRGGAESTPEQSISWSDSASPSPYTATATLSGNWFLEQVDPASGQPNTLQALDIHYTDWNGMGQTAWLLGDPEFGYDFVGIPDSAFSGNAIDPSTCQADGTCWSSKTIDYIGVDGTDYSASVIAPALPVVKASESPDPVAGSPQTFSATLASAEIPTYGLPYTYEWQFQTSSGSSPISAITCAGGVTCPSASSGSGNSSDGSSVTYGSPVSGADVSHTWPSTGVFSVQLTVTNSLGASVVQTFTVTVGASLPAVQVTASAGVEGTAQSFSAATVGSATYGLPLSYSWQFQTVNGAPVICLSLSGCPAASPYSTPVSGATATTTWPTSGTYTVLLTITNSLGQSETVDLSDSVADVAPVLSVSSSCPSSPSCLTVDLSGTVDHAGSDDSEDLSVYWGDGSGAGASSSPGSSFSNGAVLTNASATVMDLSASHTYTEAGTYTITVTVVDQSGAPATQTLEVTVGTTQAIELSRTPDQRYGNPPAAVSATGGASGQPVVIVSSTPSVCTVGGVQSAATSGAPATTNASVTLLAAGTCTLTANQAGVGTYFPAAQDTESFTVHPAPLTIAAEDESMTYGSPVPVFAVTYRGFVNGDSPSVVSGLSCSALGSTGNAVSASTPVGQYKITCSGATAANYTISYETGQLNINRAPLTVTANDETMTYGGPLPALTASYSGFVNGESASSLAYPARCSTMATPRSGVGTYTITCDGVADPNYDITYKAGTLTVTAAPLIITPDDETMAYGAAVPSFPVSYSGFVDGNTASVVSGLSCAALDASGNPVTSATAPGTYAIACSGASATDYTISYGTGTLTIEAAGPGQDLTSTSTTVTTSGLGLTATATTTTTTGPSEPGTTTATTGASGQGATTPTPGTATTTTTGAASGQGTTTTTAATSRGTTGPTVPVPPSSTTSGTTSTTNPGATSTTNPGTTSTTSSRTTTTTVIRSGPGGSPAHLPEVLRLLPDAGSTAGGTRVVIRGRWFDHVEAVSFGPDAAPFSVVSGEELIARAPGGTGTVAVVVTTAAGASDPRKADQYTYFARSQVLQLSPASGPKAGHTMVVVKGKGFNDVEKVSFGVHAAQFKVVSAEEVIARSPRGTGTVAVVVTTPGGASAKGRPDRFSYMAGKGK
jgi:hypothetical protein